MATPTMTKEQLRVNIEKYLIEMIPEEERSTCMVTEMVVVAVSDLRGGGGYQMVVFPDQIPIHHLQGLLLQGSEIAEGCGCARER